MFNWHTYESLQGGKSLDGIIGAFDKVFADIKNDDRLKTYFDDVRHFEHLNPHRS